VLVTVVSYGTTAAPQGANHTRTRSWMVIDRASGGRSWISGRNTPAPRTGPVTVAVPGAPWRARRGRPRSTVLRAPGRAAIPLPWPHRARPWSRARRESSTPTVPYGPIPSEPRSRCSAGRRVCVPRSWRGRTLPAAIAGHWRHLPTRSGNDARKAHGVGFAPDVESTRLGHPNVCAYPWGCPLHREDKPPVDGPGAVKRVGEGE
jgi:hypothetical protein